VPQNTGSVGQVSVMSGTTAGFHITTGSDMVLAAAAAQDDASTMWASGGQTWSVIMRLPAPHELGCL
jgi:hypothetical protein